MKPVDIDRFKVVFIDFDDSAVIHIDHGKWDNFNKDLWEGNENTYKLNERVVPLPGLMYLLKRFKVNHANVYCVTWAYTSLVVKPKTAALIKAYGEGMFKEVISVCSREYKIKLMREFCSEYGIDTSDVLVIEDHPDTVHESLEAGYTVMTPQEVSCRYANSVFE